MTSAARSEARAAGTRAATAASRETRTVVSVSDSRAENEVTRETSAVLRGAKNCGKRAEVSHD